MKKEFEKVQALMIREEDLQKQGQQLTFAENTLLFGLITKLMKPLEEKVKDARGRILIEMDKLGTKQWKNEVAQFSVTERTTTEYLNDVPSKIAQIDMQIDEIQEEIDDRVEDLQDKISVLEGEKVRIKAKAIEDGEAHEVVSGRFITCRINKD
jgi:hypothetical protein